MTIFAVPNSVGLSRRYTDENETDFSTFCSQATQQAWLSQAHGFCQWSQCIERASPEGTEEAER